MKQVYNQSFDLLKTGDLVFYRPMRDTRTMGWLCGKIMTWIYRSPYVYVGVLTKIGEDYQVVGTRDRWQLLPYVLKDRDVDIYRVTRDTNVRLERDAFESPITTHTYTFDGQFAVSKVHELIGKKTSWLNHILFGIKGLFCNKFSNDEQIIKVVNCATVIEYAFNEVGFDFCPRVSPNYATIDIISRSSLIDYLFTLTNDANQHQDQSVDEGVQRENTISHEI